MASELAEWKAELEKEVMDIIKNQLVEKLKLLVVEWERFKESPYFTTTVGYVNPLIGSDAPNMPAVEGMDTLKGFTGPNPAIERQYVHRDEVASHPMTEAGVREFLVAQARDLQSMATSVRLHITLIAPPKRSAENLEASVQSDIAGRIDSVINWCVRFLSGASSLSNARSHCLTIARHQAESHDLDQYIYENDQVVAVSFTRCFFELHYIIAFLSDTFEVHEHPLLSQLSDPPGSGPLHLDPRLLRSLKPVRLNTILTPCFTSFLQKNLDLMFSKSRQGALSWHG